MEQPRILIGSVALFCLSVVAMSFGLDLGVPIGWILIAATLLFAAPELRSFKISTNGIEFELAERKIEPKTNPDREPVRHESETERRKPTTPEMIDEQRARLASEGEGSLGQLPIFLLVGTIGGIASASIMKFFSDNVIVYGGMLAMYALILMFAFGLAQRKFTVDLLYIGFVGMVSLLVWGHGVATYIGGIISDDFNWYGVFFIFLAGTILSVGVSLFRPQLQRFVPVALVTFVTGLVFFPIVELDSLYMRGGWVDNLAAYGQHLIFFALPTGLLGYFVPNPPKRTAVPEGPLEAIAR
ncbi:hypothetical protein CN187_23795 [Sinorhizobium meliloti]|uniref:hypothetical protein n=1 Tax=Rhizobium meliloti TaxID=382 RepID=UPI000FD6C0AF|nr:hypothetical protein [Sinorhizobium meliloti]RVI63897.1 hypothetical protein CN187_23795 [Sinorhizobium meliloti]